jgi:ATP-dependent DNA helicase RecQ
VDQLGEGIKIVSGPLDRPSLKLQVIDLPDKAHRMAWLADVIPTLPGSGIVYTLTIADATRTAAFLRSCGIDARSYTGPTDVEQRLEIEELLSANRLKVVVATSALAMGYDNPFIEFVIHFQIPGSAISYYQQVGRAGRAVDSSYGIALAGVEDKRIQDYFIDTAFPSEDVVGLILKALSEAGGLTINELLSHVNIRYKRLEAALNLLDVERAVYKEDAKWYRSAERWEYPRERFEHVTAQRKAEQAAMAQYVTSTDCLMQQLRGLLDDSSEPCGRCANCIGPLLPESAGDQNIARAEAFLKSEKIAIPPKKRSPSGLPGLSLPSAEEGRVLSRYNEPGFGVLVRSGKYETKRFDDALLEGAVRLMHLWRPTPYPTWIVAVADAKDGGLVEDFARRLAERLDLPFDQTIRRANRVAEQKEMENSYMQAANAMKAFEAIRSHTGPVLLIDDIVDSGWTLTIVADLLRKNGAVEVFPLALATAAGS